MPDIDRDDIHLINKYSDLPVAALDELLVTHVYNDTNAWKKFLNLFFIILGLGFTVFGIIFFFAYNWDSLHKFVKIGLIEGLIVIAIGSSFFIKANEIIKNLIISTASVLVGVLFAVFGQIYQTGANAYDFFLGWTAFVTLWAIAANFLPLWLIFIALINTTITLYSEQVALDWSGVCVCCILGMIDIVALIAFEGIGRFTGNKTETWFSNILSLASVTIITIGICFGIFDDKQAWFYILLTFTVVVYTVGLIYGLRFRSGFYLSIIPFSMVVMLSTYFLQQMDNEAGFLFTSLFVIVSITLIIRNLFSLQKKPANEQVG